jgi:hypothetical protein
MKYRCSTFAPVEYEWWIGAESLLVRANVTRSEVVEVLYAAHWERYARTPHGPEVLTVWGRTNEGRPLVVVLHEKEPGCDQWEIIRAVPMSPRSLAIFTQWEERQR